MKNELEHQKNDLVKICKCFIIKQFQVQGICQEGYLSVSLGREFLLEVPLLGPILMTHLPVNKRLLKNQILANLSKTGKFAVKVTGPSQYPIVHMEKVNIIILYQHLCKHVENLIML